MSDTLEFTPCPTCIEARDASQKLCQPCFHNRWVIERLRVLVSDALLALSSPSERVRLDTRDQVAARLGVKAGTS